MRHIHKSIALTDRSSPGEARRAAILLAQSMGFDEGRRNDIGIVATEAANNVILHAKTGELLICPYGESPMCWIDLMAVDAGPGIADVARAMTDGYSTIGTPGQGLGAISRLSDISSLHSIPGKGTVYWSRFAGIKAVAATALGVVSVPVKGELVCGDGYFAIRSEARSLFVVVDGLGHGSGAAEAAVEALRVVHASTGEKAMEILTRTHDALKKTRGAAMSVSIVDHDRKILTYAGIGNVSASITTGGVTRGLVSQNGTLGAVLPRVVQEYVYPVERNSLLLMFSDGLASKTSVSGYAGLHNQHPALLAGLLHRDFTRKRDDATVLMARLDEVAK